MRFSEATPIEAHLAVGWVKRAHHLRGEIFVSLFSGEIFWTKGLTQVLLSQKKKSQIYVVTRLRPHKNGIILALEGVADRSQSEALKGYQVSIAKDLMPPLDGDEFYYHELLDFQLFDESKKLLGKVTGFRLEGTQDLLVIQGEKDSFLVPFVKELIIEVNSEAKILKMRLPEGLEDL